MEKIPADVQKRVNKLPEETRKKVEWLVARHVDACRRMGIEPEGMSRVWIESIEEVENGEVEFYVHSRRGEGFETGKRYDVYTSPTDTSLD